MSEDESKKKPVLKTIGGVASIPVTLGVLGLIAQLSQYEFLGLPAEQSKANFAALLKSSETEGFLFVFHTVTDAGFGYLAENPYGIIAFACVVAFFLSFYLLRRKKVAVVVEPLFLLPLIFIGSLVVLMRYDVPVRPFMDVLRSQSTTIDAFEVPPAFQSRTQQIWTDIVCARVASSPAAANLCPEPQGRYKRNVDGRYFRNVLYTMSMVVLLLLLYVLREAAETKELLRNALFVLAGLGVALNLLALPYVYSRSVRSTAFPLGHPRKATVASPAYTIRTSKDESFGYRLDSADFDVSSAEIEIDNNDRDDVLRAHLLEALGAPRVLPPTKQPLRMEKRQ